jgi:hypothetical protein
VPGEGRGEAVEGGLEAGKGEGVKHLMTQCELRLRRARTSKPTGDTFSKALSIMPQIVNALGHFTLCSTKVLSIMPSIVNALGR